MVLARTPIPHVWLIAFIPLVIASGGNSGNQSATLVITALSMGVLLSIPETLMDDRPEGSGSWTVRPDRKPAHRKPFRLSTANPIANIALLFRNGPGLRALATATTIDFSNNE